MLNEEGRILSNYIIKGCAAVICARGQLSSAMIKKKVICVWRTKLVFRSQKKKKNEFGNWLICNCCGREYFIKYFSEGGGISLRVGSMTLWFQG